MFIDKFNQMLEVHGTTGYAVCKAIGIPDNYPKSWKDGCERNPEYTPNAKIMKKLAEYFHVSTDFFYELEDEYGLNVQDWWVIASLIGDWLKAMRLDFKQVFQDAGIVDVNVEDFKNGIVFLTAEQIEKIGEAAHHPDIKGYLPVVYSAKLWPEMQKVAPDTGDDLNDAQRRFVQLMSDLTPEEAVAAVAYIQGLRDKQSRL